MTCFCLMACFCWAPNLPPEWGYRLTTPLCTSTVSLNMQMLQKLYSRTGFIRWRWENSYPVRNCRKPLTLEPWEHLQKSLTSQNYLWDRRSVSHPQAMNTNTAHFHKANVFTFARLTPPLLTLLHSFSERSLWSWFPPIQTFNLAYYHEPVGGPLLFLSFCLSFSFSLCVSCSLSFTLSCFPQFLSSHFISPILSPIPFSSSSCSPALKLEWLAHPAVITTFCVCVC